VSVVLDDWAEDLPSEDIDAAVEEQHVWRAVMELAPDGVFLETTEGEILHVNEAGAAMFGYTPEEMVGLGISDLVPEDFAATLPPEITRVTGPGTVRRFNRRRDGTVFPTEISTRFIAVAGEKRLVAYVRDISESLEAFRELEAALEKVEALFGIVPICMSCGDVRDDQGYWTRVHDFVSDHAGTQFSHGVCPRCLARLYPDYVED
jgi:PAS domain S-box-containing protein